MQFKYNFTIICEYYCKNIRMYCKFDALDLPVNLKYNVVL